MASDPERHVMEKLMHWTPIDDMLCGSVFVNGRRAARAARNVGGRRADRAEQVAAVRPVHVAAVPALRNAECGRVIVNIGKQHRHKTETPHC